MKKSSGAAHRFNDVRFVQYELTKEQAAACKKVEATADGLWGSLLNLCDSGYSLSVRFDDYSKAYACFLSVRDVKHINHGLILTGRGSSPQKAFKQLMFKHHVIMEEDWTGFAERPVGEEMDD